MLNLYQYQDHQSRSLQKCYLLPLMLVGQSYRDRSHRHLLYAHLRSAWRNAHVMAQKSGQLFTM